MAIECEPLEGLYVETVGGGGKCRAFMFVFGRRFAVFLIGPNCVAHMYSSASVFSQNTKTRFRKWVVTRVYCKI